MGAPKVHGMEELVGAPKVHGMEELVGAALAATDVYPKGTWTAETSDRQPIVARRAIEEVARGDGLRCDDLS